jgi:putative ABC transport system permease protein
VVNDTISVRAGEPDEAIVYQPLYTATVAATAPVVQIHADATGVGDLIHARVQMLDARLTARPATVMAIISRDASRYASVIRVTAMPAGLAVFLSLVSVYGLAAFAAAQRAHEIGVRIACGARPRAVVRLFLGSVQRPFVGGVLGGTALAAVGVWALRRTALALDLPPADPLALVTAIGLLFAAALIATAVPALRAARKDPWSVLRQ